MPYRFIDTIAMADVAFEARGATREELFREAAEAVLHTMVALPERVERRRELALSLAEPELDLLLFAFLQELVYFKDAQGLLLHADDVTITEQSGVFRLEALCRGEKIDRKRHLLLVDVKAVTLHRLAVVLKHGTWQATVVLDV